MINQKTYSKLVGNYIKSKREDLKISQKQLGAMLHSSVTTQFISNIERGVTPLPARHVPAIAKALHIPETEILLLLEKDYAHKVAQKASTGEPHSHSHKEEKTSALFIETQDYLLVYNFYKKFKTLNQKERAEWTNKMDSLIKGGQTQ